MREHGNPEFDNETQFNKVKNLCAVYGFTNGHELTISLLSEQRKVREYRTQQAESTTDLDTKRYQVDKVERISSEIRWTERNRSEIEKFIGSGNV